MTERLTIRRTEASPASPLVWLVRIAFVVAFVWIFGFLQYVYALPDLPPDPLPKADGIVALTGGGERVVAAMALLNDNKAGRLLISGVHPDTTRDDLKKHLSDPGNKFDCCVDLDRAARNTAGNAIETARWVRKNGYHSVILVTAQYHMPRSLIELKRELPDVTLFAYPVYPDQMHARDWWRDLGTARLLGGEYVKYLVARLRIAIAERLGPPPLASPSSASGA